MAFRSTRQRALANITVEYSFIGDDRGNNRILHRPLFLEYTFVLGSLRIFGLLYNTSLCVCGERGLNVTGPG